MLRLAKKEKIIFPYMSAKYGTRSVLRWLVPYGTHNMRIRPLFTFVSFCFHFCLLITPLFVMGHAVRWQQSWGVRWWSLPPAIVDLMTLAVVFAGLFFFLRRATAPEVRNVTSSYDFLILLLVISPFVTGFLAHRQWLPYDLMITLHVICGALWLIAIPFTRLAHMLWFVFTRSFMGSEFGAVRNARDW
jgi:nitrate reductase gamma subunit